MNKPAIIGFKLSQYIREIGVVALYDDGTNMRWRNAKTERGARMILKQEAKARGFVVTGDTAQAATE